MQHHVFDRQDSIAFENPDHGRHSAAIPIDWESPDQVLMAKEFAAGLDDGDPDLLAVKKIPPDALGTILRLILPPRRGGASRWRISSIRLAVLAHACQIDDFGEMRLAAIARELGVTRALVSQYALRLVDQLGLDRLPSQKRRVTREIYRRTAIAAHRRAGHTVTGEHHLRAPFA